MRIDPRSGQARVAALLLALALAACRPPNAPKEPVEPNEPTDQTIQSGGDDTATASRTVALRARVGLIALR